MCILSVSPKFSPAYISCWFLQVTTIFGCPFSSHRLRRYRSLEELRININPVLMHYTKQTTHFSRNYLCINSAYMPVAASANIRKKVILLSGLKQKVVVFKFQTHFIRHLRAHCDTILPVLIFKSCLTTNTCDQNKLKLVTQMFCF